MTQNNFISFSRFECYLGACSFAIISDKNILCVQDKKSDISKHYFKISQIDKDSFCIVYKNGELERINFEDCTLI